MKFLPPTWPSWLLGIVLTVFGAFAVARFSVVGFGSILGLCIFLVLAFLTVRSPRFGILAVAFLLPFERVGSVDVAGFTLRSSQVFGGLTLVAWLLYLLVRRRWSFQPNPSFWIGVTFLGIALLSVSQAENTFRAMSVWIFVAFTVMVSWLVPQLIRQRSHLDRLITVLFVSTSIIGVFGLYQFMGDLVGLPPSLTGLRDLYTSDVFGFPRIQSTFLEPLYYANFLLIPLSLALVFLLSGKGKQSRLFLVAFILLLGVNFVLTLSRGAYIALAVMLIILAFAYWKKVFTPHWIVLGVVVAVIVGWGAVQFLGFTGDTQGSVDTFTRQATDIFSGASYFDRAETFTQAWDLFLSHPYLGIGIGNFGPAVADAALVQPSGGWLIVNNEFLELLAETGVFGLVAYLSLLLVLFWRSVKAIRRSRDPYLRAVMLALLIAFIGILVQYNTFSILFIMHIWSLFGLMIAVQNIAMQNDELPVTNLR